MDFGHRVWVWVARLMGCALLGTAVLSMAQDRPVASLELPDAPPPQAPVQVAAQAAGPQQPATAASGSLYGTVLDPNGNAIQDAKVTLSKAATESTLREVTSSATGGFEFIGLQPGTYVVSVSSPDMTQFVSQPVVVRADEPVTVANVVLSVAGTTSSVTVMDAESASIEQEHIAEQQRVFGVFSNFYSSFDWNAPPMLNKQKYGLAVHTLIDPVSFLITGGLAAGEQYRNVFPSFGGGWEGFAKRYGATYASHASGELFTRAIYPSIFHQDPRYFVMERGSNRERALHAVTSTFVTRTDKGRHRINYSEIFGSLSAGALTEAYYPASERGVSLFLINGLGELGGNAFDNLFREFVFNRVTRRARSQTNP